MGGKAAQALGKIGNRRAVEPLIESFRWSHSVGIHATEALGNLGDKTAIEPVFKFSQWVGGYYGDKHEIESQEGRIAAAEALVKLGDGRSLDLLLAQISFLSDDYQHINPYPVVVKGMRGNIDKGTNRDLRNRIITALGRLGEKKAINVVSKFLVDGDPNVRLQAAESLSQLRAVE